jgi:hypothetical protein
MIHDRQTRSHKYYLQIPNTKINTFAFKGKDSMELITCPNMKS